MFIPSHFKITDRNLAMEFIRQYNFGILLCNGSGFPQATHLPFYLKEENESLFLITHLAKANVQWEQIEKEKKCLVIFNGPHGYVSPSGYEHPQNVPTWNYMTVHIKALATVIHGTEEKKQILDDTIKHQEKEYGEQYKRLSSDYLEPMFKAIVGLRLEVESIETKFKLSQNKSKRDQEKVAEIFEMNGNTALAAWMRKVNHLK